MTWVETAAWWIGAAWLFVGATFAVVLTFGFTVGVLVELVGKYLRRAGSLVDCLNWILREHRRKQALKDIASGAETQESN